MTAKRANYIYTLLETIGAASSQREAFVHAMTQPQPPAEWRFGGALGYGAKFYPQENRVGCYSENLTPSVEGLVQATNKLLQQFFPLPATH